MTSAWLNGLADFLSGPIIVPSVVRDRGALILADTIGAIAAGTVEPEFVRLSKDTSFGGPISIPGTRLQVHRLRATLLNGIAGTSVEIDEGHYAAGGHPAIHCLAAALPEAETLDCSGADLLDALVIAYEAAARIGGAIKLRDPVHSHGTWGTVGAAVAVARLRGFSAARMASALRVASGLTLATSRTSGLAGATIRNVYAGLAAQTGAFACDLVEAGVDGEADGFAIIFGTVTGEAFDPSRILDGLGSDWAVNGNFFKRHASCRETHGAIDAWEKLAGDIGAGLPKADEIRSIEITTFGQAARLDEAHPKTPLAARYSLPFALATRIVRGSAEVADFHAAAVADPAIQALAGKVRLLASPVLDARLPAERVTRMIVSRDDGSTVSAEIAGSEGDPAFPIGRDRLKDKFRRATAPVWGEDAPAVFELWAGIDQAASVAAACARSRTRRAEA